MPPKVKNLQSQVFEREECPLWEKKGEKNIFLREEEKIDFPEESWNSKIKDSKKYRKKLAIGW